MTAPRDELGKRFSGPPKMLLAFVEGWARDISAGGGEGGGKHGRDFYCFDVTS